MQNLSDQELDDLFRNASRQLSNDKEGMASGWKDMESMLAKNQTKAGYWNLKSGAVLIGVVIVSIILISLFPDNPISNETKSSIESSSEVKTEIREVEPTNSELTVTDIPLDKFIATSGQNNSEQPNTKQEGPGVKYSGDNFSEPDTHLLISDNDDLKSEDRLILPKGAVELSEPTLLVDEPESELDDEIISKNEKMIEPGEIDKHGEASPKFKKGVSIKLSVSPDYSTVNSRSPNGMGWNYGVLAEYRFGRHWIISSGLIRSRKKYSASDLEYYGYNADYVEGDCRMWDIPINIYYHFAPDAKWSFYMGTGISSYLMSQESYVYTVNSYYGKKYYNHEVNGENNEWFKILNVSMGIQNQLNNNLAIQVEPFLKAPLAGVGEGDVSLASFGAFLSLKYQFNKNKIF